MSAKLIDTVNVVSRIVHVVACVTAILPLKPRESIALYTVCEWVSARRNSWPTKVLHSFNE